VSAVKIITLAVLTRISVASYYLPYLVANVGITNTNTQLLLNIIYAITGWIPAIVGARLHDVVGRRKMLLGSTMGMAVCLSIVAGTASGYVQTGGKAVSSASIAFIYIFGSVFALAFTSMQPIYPGEVLSNDMRAKGIGVFQITAGCAGFVNTFAAPVALNNVSGPSKYLQASANACHRLATGFMSFSSSGTFSNSFSFTSSS
jgi:MFS family permease